MRWRLKRLNVTPRKDHRQLLSSCERLRAQLEELNHSELLDGVRIELRFENPLERAVGQGKTLGSGKTPDKCECLDPYMETNEKIVKCAFKYMS
ncbi:hypothetical protein L1987_23412 [Smallanthus sonchifolius]|uniref:Uncharacterized protein n=1 Tax=Smallanthus sonchifolius TaxID=185202 RepID=A0ACB9II51_9ASTR|nr:hypothetical protein L1987_23412 [Smallanthus sonchifolius]